MAIACAQRMSWAAIFSITFATFVMAQSSMSSSSSGEDDAPFWTYTSRFMKSTGLTTATYTYRTTVTSLYTRSTSDLRTIKSGVKPTATPTSISTYDSAYYYSEYDLELVYAYYTQGAVPDSDLVEEYDYYATTSTRTSSSTSTTVLYLMPVTYTQPAYCNQTSFSVVTTATPVIPSEVRDQITPTSKVTATRNYNGYGTETWYLSAGAAPSTNDYYYRSYIAQCSAPPNYRSSSGGGSGSGSSSNNNDSIGVCSWYSGCTSLKVWIVVIASIIPGLFVLGTIESYFWFRRLMIGKGALRFGTVCWIILSLWVACCTRKQAARSKEDQKILRENWNKTGTGQAIKLWFKWGFRHAYPVPLLGQFSRNTVGIVPEGQPLPQMGQAGIAYQGFQPPPSAPGATGIFYHNGQPYYVPPQGWIPPPNGQGYPMPPPGTAYMPPSNEAPVYYGEHYGPPPTQTKEATSQVSPIQEHATPQTVPSPTSPPTPVSPPSAGYSEAYAPPAQQSHHLPPGELPTMSGAQPPQGSPPHGPPPPPPT